ncbi:MAG TPA: hypothetical protein VMZ06_13555 [Candidatus Bathyarchaeia archaeon]|nr:hypothetical protein [Candidatus Bathyarchaeia archaeon]
MSNGAPCSMRFRMSGAILFCLLTPSIFGAAPEVSVTAEKPQAVEPASRLVAEPVQGQKNPSPIKTPENPKPDLVSNAVHDDLKSKWGIEVLSLRQTAGGYMLDFRYRVLDPEKAARLLDPKVKPYLVDEATGAKFIVPTPPKVGSLRASGRLAVNKNYFMFFANPGNYIKGGNKVSVVIGELRIEHLTVE